MFGIISFIISSILFGYIGYKKSKSKSEIVIIHKLNPYGWIWVHFATSIITISLFLVNDFLSDVCLKITTMPFGWRGIVCLFVQTGGLLIPIMILSSIIYNAWIRQIEFKYFVRRHQWIKKFYFTIICFTMPIIYCMEIGNVHQNNILTDVTSKSFVMWTNVLLGIWVGFGMEFNIPQWGKQLKTIQEKESREELTNLICCLGSMFLFPVLMIVWIGIVENMSISIQHNIQGGVWGFILGMSMMAIILLGDNWHRLPSKRRSLKKFEKLFEQTTTKWKKGYYSRIKYGIKENEQGIILHIYREKIKLLERNEYSATYLELVERAFASRKFNYSFQVYEKSQISKIMKNELERIAREREELLKEGWNVAYKLCENREKMFS